MHVIAPTWRSTGDISIKDDVMEEVARMYGYDNFEPTSFTTTFDSAINQKDQDLVRNMKEYPCNSLWNAGNLHISLGK